MSAYTYLAQHVLAPALDAFRGTSTMRQYTALRESQWWPRDRILELQSARLRRLIPYCYLHVPYYRKVMDQRGIAPTDMAAAEDMARLPVTTKELVRAQPDAFLAEGFPQEQLMKGRTGGSTGTPLEFFSTRDSHISHGVARALRAREWAGIRPGDPAVYITKGRAEPSRTAAAARRLRHYVGRSSLIDAAQLSDATLPLAVETIARAHRPALVGYTSAIYIIAAFIQEKGLPVPPVSAVIYGGEPIHALQKETIRAVFGIDPLSKYSSFENYEIAMECPSQGGMHVAAEDLVVEIVDDSGNPLPAGATGRVLVTDLHNFGMPLLRYDTGDIGSLKQGSCECGRGLPVMSLSVARSGDILYTPSGKRISPLALGVSALASLGVRQLQFVQKRLDRVAVRLVLSQTLHGDDLSALKARVVKTFAHVLGDDVDIDVVLVDSIEPTAAGKHRFVISEIGPKEIDRSAGNR